MIPDHPPRNIKEAKVTDKSFRLNINIRGGVTVPDPDAQTYRHQDR